MERQRRRRHALAGRDGGGDVVELDRLPDLRVKPFGGGAAGFVRWAYPGLWFPLTLPIASELGALAGRSAEVGAPAFGAVYGPLLFLHWWFVRPRSDVLVTALAVGYTTFLVSAVCLLSAMVSDYRNGRDWGWLDPIVGCVSWLSELLVSFGGGR